MQRQLTIGIKGTYPKIDFRRCQKIIVLIRMIFGSLRTCFLNWSGKLKSETVFFQHQQGQEKMLFRQLAQMCTSVSVHVVNKPVPGVEK